jgi:hypothetical protein
MQNNILKCAFALLTVFVLALFFVPVRTSAHSTPVAKCDAPGVVITGQGSNYATFSIETPSADFQYWYVNKSTNTNSGTITASGSTLTIGGLSSGAYDVYFQSICPGEGVSEYVVIDLIL